jgi:glyoxylase-like metal-dependent hydrolase (beta-lactamase superfamily II)
MQIHHLNCMTFHLGAPAITHCLLIEATDGLVLVDTGLGLGDYADPTPLVRAFTALNRVPCDLEETAVRQIARLGYAPEDVQHIVLTHLHIDHAGGLPDFPWAKVHVFAPEYEAAMSPGRFSFTERFYVARHWAHGPEWVIHRLEGETWFELDCVRVIEDELLEVLLVPLVGHSRGHCGVAVKTPQEWLLHCGDAFVRPSQVDPRDSRSPFPSWAGPLERRLFPGGPLLQLRALMRDHGEDVRLFCAHDPRGILQVGETTVVNEEDKCQISQINLPVP